MKINRCLPALALLWVALPLNAGQNFTPRPGAAGAALLSVAGPAGIIAHGAIPVAPPAPVRKEDPDNSMPMGNTAGYAVVAWHAIAAAVADSGLLFWKDAPPDFNQLSRSVERLVEDTRFAPRAAGGPSLLEEEGFIAEMETITGAAFLPGNSVKPLIDGPEAFEIKYRLIRGAAKHIRIATFALYDDATGRETTEMLLERRRAGVEVKLMVDDKMSNIFGKALLERLREGGVDVLRYKDADRPHDYLHMKILLVDGQAAVTGGMNYGDPYSHRAGSLKWRDTDALYTGAAVAETERLFAREWNARVPAARRIAALPAAPACLGPARVASLQQNPPTLTPPILLSIIKAISGATRRVNIENAYLLAIPAVNRAIVRARERGVEVNVLTNSKESIDPDGKAMADLIVEGTAVFAAAGANVYLKKGDTLHSKFMTVDGVFANIGSYNLHPRSERHDTEFNISVLDRDSVTALDAAFDRDIAAAERVTLNDLERKKPGLLSRIAAAVGYAQLSPGALPKN